MKRYQPDTYMGDWNGMVEDPDGEWVRFEDYQNCLSLLTLVMDQPTDMQVALDNAKKEIWVRVEELDEIRAERARMLDELDVIARLHEDYENDSVGYRSTLLYSARCIARSVINEATIQYEQVMKEEQ